MHHLSRRRVAMLATAATLAGGSLATVSTVANAAEPVRQQGSEQLLPLLGGPLGGILGSIVGQTVAVIAGLIEGLSAEDVGALLVSAQPSDVPNLLAAAQQNNQLIPALGTLSADQNGDLLAPRTGTSLTTLIGGLTGSGKLVPALGALTGPETAGLLNVADPTQLTSLLGVLTGDQLTGALSLGQIGDLLAPANATNLTSLLGLLDATELTGVLATLNVGELGGLLDIANAGQLTSIVGLLTPSQIDGLVGTGDSASIIYGLLGTATGLGGTPGSSQVNGLVGQVTALLGGGVPVLGDADLISLLGVLDPLLATTGVDTGLLSSLLTTVNGVLGAAPVGLRAPLQSIVTTIGNVLSPPATGGGDGGGGSTMTPGTTTTPGATATTARPGATAARSGATTQPAAAAMPGPYRATIGALKLSKKRTSMKLTLTCAKSAPKGCLVQISAKIAGKKAIRSVTVALPSGKSTPVTVTLSRSTTKRLKKKGGSLSVTAKTALSTLGAVTESVKVKRPKKKR